MIAATVVSVLLVVVSALIHYEALRLVNDFLPTARLIASRAKVLVALNGALISHLFQIALFGAAYYLLQDKFGLGAFEGQFTNSFASFLYFSAETYTTLGFGDIYPVGQLRLLTGIESLTGLLMISWTASFTYLEMRRYWE
jgi:Ion channel